MTKTAIDFRGALNPEQFQAVTHETGPLVVLAGAGSGKTRVITFRVAWLVRERGVAAGEIAAVTFTNKAAAEMRERIEGLLGLHPLPSFVGTFHRFALRLLRIYGPKVGLPQDFAILDAADQLSLVKRGMKQAGVDETSFRPQALLAAISSAKNQLIGPAQYDREAADFFSRKVAAVYQHYQAALREAGGVDFDDMLRLAVELLRTQEPVKRRLHNQYRHVLVDEFQDTNHAQLCLIEELCGPLAQLTAVGDEDQSIYRWRGAELANILEFERTFNGATVRKLERNYRSTQTILDASGGLIAHNESRRGKRLWTEAGTGEKVLLYRGHDEQDEGRWVSNTLAGLEARHGFGNMAVLVRTHAQTRTFEDFFLRRGIPYRLVAGVRFYERAEVKDVLAYLRLLRKPDDALALERVLNRPARGIGKASQDQLRALAEAAGRSQWQVLHDDAVLHREFNTRAAQALRRFRQLIAELKHTTDGLPLPALLRQVLDATAYLKQFDPQNEEDKARLENIDELLSSASEFSEKNTYGAENDDLLAAFLDHVALTSDTDALGGPGVSLMTLHSAKGLEFDVVVVAGLEEGLLPHFNSRAESADLEEERRLLYVGMTRARARVVMTACQRRRMAGQYQDRLESRFLAEIPAHLVHVEKSPELFGRPARRDYGGGYGGGYGGEYGRGRRSFDDQEDVDVSSSQARDVFSFFGKSAPTPAAAELEVVPEPEAVERREPFVARTPRRGVVERGARVRHAKLGIGKVMQIEGTGEDAKLIIYFDGVGRRKLIAKYANLDVL